MEAVFDRHGVVADDLELDPVIEGVLAQLGDLFAHRFGHGDGIGALGLHDIHGQRDLTVEHGEAFAFRQFGVDPGDIAQPHRVVAAPGDDDLVEIGQRLDPALDLDRLLGGPFSDRTCGQVGVFGCQRAGDL